MATATNGTYLWSSVIQIFRVRVRVMMLYAAFNNISVISWGSVLLVEESGENYRPVASFLAFQSFDFQRTRWRMFQKRAVRTKC